MSFFNFYQNTFGDSDLRVIIVNIKGNIIFKRTLKQFLYMSILMLAWRSLLILTCGYKEKEKTIFIQSNFLAINIDRNSQERITIRTDINVTNSLKYRVKIAGWMMLAAISIGAHS